MTSWGSLAVPEAFQNQKKFACCKHCLFCGGPHNHPCPCDGTIGRGNAGETVSGLPTNAADRKATPVYSGVLKYFPLALAEVARVSKAGNDQHNPGEPLHWARGKSTDHADCATRHLMEAGTMDTDGQRHSAKLAWRALALLQEELEAAVTHTR